MTEFVTTEEFLLNRYEYPEAGQWSELEAGRVVHFQPPDLDHGTVVLNLSKALAEYAQAAEQGYACFDLGLQLRSAPDTIRFPAACFFNTGPRFQESDRQVTQAVPALVVELASTDDRRHLQSQRSEQYLDWGVQTVWSIDPKERSVGIFQPSRSARTLFRAEPLLDEAVLPQFRIAVESLFTEPSWWNPKPPPRG